MRRLIRSALFVPASKPRAIQKATHLGADMLILDLEDAVGPGEKEDARKAAETAATRVDFYTLVRGEG